MATDVSILGVGVDSSGVRKGTDDLRDFARRGAEAEKAAERLQTKSVALGSAIGTTIANGINTAFRAMGRLIDKFQELAESAGEAQDVAEAYGGTAESFESMRIAATVAGISIQQLGLFSAKAARGLTGVEDETKKAGAALKFLGISVDEFKSKDPAGQFELVAGALTKVNNAQSAGAALQEIYGRGANKLLVFFNELRESGGAQVILTQKLIEQADFYSDAQKRQSATLDAYLKLIVGQILPAVTAFKGALVDLIKELIGVDGKTNQLSNNDGIRRWAEDAAVGIADFVDGVRTAISVFPLLFALGDEAVQRGKKVLKFATAGSFVGAAKLAQSYVNGEMDEMNKDIDAARVRSVDAMEKFLEQDEKRFGNLVRNRIKQGRALEGANKGLRGGLEYDGVDKKGKKPKKLKEEKGQVTDKDLLGYDINDLRSALDTAKEAQRNAEAENEALRSAGLRSDEEYYAERLNLMRAANREESTELQAEINRYQTFIDQRKGTDRDRAEAQQKIGENEVKLGRLRDSLASREFVLGLQRDAALKSTARAYEEARLAAEDYLRTLGLQQQRELDAFGKGDEGRRRAAAQNQIADQYQRQRQDLEKNKQLLEFEGKFTDQQRDEYVKRLALISEFETKALAQWDDYYGRLRAKEKDAMNGIQDALINYSDTAGFTAANVEAVTSKAFKGMEDAIVEFAKTGKLSFKSMIDSFVADIIRLTVQQQLIKPIADYLSGGGGGSGFTPGSTQSGSGTGGWLASLVNTGLSLYNSFQGGGGINIDTAGSGVVAADSSLSATGQMIRDRRALGGPVRRGGIYQVNENGPEILEVGGKSILMTDNAKAKPTGAGFKQIISDIVQKADDEPAGEVAGKKKPKGLKEAVVDFVRKGASILDRDEEPEEVKPKARPGFADVMEDLVQAGTVARDRKESESADSPAAAAQKVEGREPEAFSKDDKPEVVKAVAKAKDSPNEPDVLRAADRAVAKAMGREANEPEVMLAADKAIAKAKGRDEPEVLKAADKAIAKGKVAGFTEVVNAMAEKGSMVRDGREMAEPELVEVGGKTVLKMNGAAGTVKPAGSDLTSPLIGVMQPKPDGARALGGPVNRGGMYRVNEKGPEVLQTGGKSYLMMHGAAGSVKAAGTTNNSKSETRQQTFNINQSFSPGTDKRTINQAAAAAKGQLRRAERVT